MDVAKRIKELRKAKGISAETIAEYLGTNPTTIYRYEKGDIEKMPLSVLEPIARILGCSPAYLMGWTDDPNINVQNPNNQDNKSYNKYLNSYYSNTGLDTSDNNWPFDVSPFEIEDAINLFERYKKASPRDQSIVDSLLKPDKPDS